MAYSKFSKEEMAEYKNKQEKLRAEMEEDILEMIENFQVDPGVMAEFFEFYSKFHQYSQRNRMIIYQQNPNAMFCASFNGFKKMGYSINKGEKGMNVFVPVSVMYIKYRQNGEVKTVRYSDASESMKTKVKLGELETYTYNTYRIGKVFDISQTNCPRRDYPNYIDVGFESIEHRKMFDMLKDFAEDELRIKVNEGGITSIATRGEYDPSNKVISTSGIYDDSSQLSILTHEIGHAILHNDLSSFGIEMYIREFEADCVSIMLLKKLGFDIPLSRLEHAKSQVQSIYKHEYSPQNVIFSSMERAEKAFDMVIDYLSKRTGIDISCEKGKTFDNGIKKEILSENKEADISLGL